MTNVRQISNIRDMPDVSAASRSPALPPRAARPIGERGLKALAAPVRRSMIDLLGERPATVTELAATLGKAKGTIAHHMDVLVAAELVEVVATRRVRAIEERIYGRTAPTFVLPKDHLDSLGSFGESWRFEDAAVDARRPLDHEAAFTSVRYVRVPHDRAHEFAQRLTDLLDDFVAEPRAGDVVYGLLAALFPTDRPHLPDEEAG